MTDPTTISDRDLHNRISVMTRTTADFEAAAKRAEDDLATHKTRLAALDAESAFRAAVKELRRQSSAKRVAILRTLAGATDPIGADGPTDWLNKARLISWTRNQWDSYDTRRWSITDLGRRALAALETP